MYENDFYSVRQIFNCMQLQFTKIREKKQNNATKRINVNKITQTRKHDSVLLSQ